MAFDAQSALKAGYTPQEIQSYLGNQPKSPWLNTALQIGGQIAGGYAGGEGGAALGALVPGADLTGVPEALGGFAGAVMGAGAGAGAGDVGANFIRKNLLNDQTVNANDTLPEAIDAAKGGAIGEAIGGPLGKVLGFAAHPIKPAIDQVDKILANSSKTVNIGDLNGLLSTFQKQIIPKLEQDGYGPEAQATLNSVRKRIVSMTQSRLKQAPGIASTTEIGGLTVPIAAANGIKRDLYQLAKNTYNGVRQRTDVLSPLEQSGAADFAGLLKNEIAKQEPGVKFPNAYASTMYKAQDVAKGLTQILPGPAAHAVQVLASLPRGFAQSALSTAGKLSPSLVQLLYGASRDQQNQ